MDYRSSHLNWKEILQCTGMSLLLSAIIAWLLYRSRVGMLSFFFLFPVLIRRRKRSKTECKKQQLLLEFKDAMQSISAALLAGYSVENAWREGEKEMQRLHGADACMVKELRQMNAAVRMNRPLEQELAAFAERSGCEDIESFAEVFLFAKRSGGDFGKIIRTTVSRISGKIEVEREIATVISGKKMEQRVMNVVPAFLLGYLNFTSEEFLAPLYGNTFGVIVMTAAFLVYLAAVRLSEKIMNIRM